MSKEKKTKFIILGFLLHESMSGYEIGEIIKDSTNNFWHESDASIYPTLKLLKAEDLVSSEVSYVGKRRKEIFTITELGKKSFLQWYKKSPERDLHREEFLLKLFFTDKTTEKEMEKHCQDKLEELKKVQEKYKELESFLKEQLPDKRYWLKTLQIGIAHLELDINLLQKL